MLRSWITRYAPVAIWMAVIFFFSAQPSLPAPPDPLLSVIIRKFGHLTEYAILMILLLRAINPQALTRRSIMLSAVILLLYAISDEFHQSFVATRHPTIIDVFIDSIGGTLGLITWHAILRRGLACRQVVT